MADFFDLADIVRFYLASVLRHRYYYSATPGIASLGQRPRKGASRFPGLAHFYEAKPPHNADSFPAVPETLAENPPTLLQAFTAASETTDPSPTRYALANVRFRGDDGSLASSDGKQLLRQEGFEFPWKGDLLVAHSKVFASRGLPDDQPLLVGKSAEWAIFNIGQWFIHLRIDATGRFPNVEQIIPATDKAIGSCRFSNVGLKFPFDGTPEATGGRGRHAPGYA